MRKLFKFKKVWILTVWLLVLFLTAQNSFSQNFNYKSEINEQTIKILNFDKTNQNTIVKLDFEFVFAGKSYKEVYISPQGWLSFEPIEQNNIKDLSDVNCFVTPFFSDKNEEVDYELTNIGNEKALIVQWRIEKSMISQLILNETGSIIFSYQKPANFSIPQNFQAGIITEKEVLGRFSDKIDKISNEINFNFNNSYYFDNPADTKLINKYNNQKIKSSPKATDTYATPGDNTWTCPAGVTSVTVHCIGGGGAGGGTTVNTRYGGGGGAGGSYATKVITVVPGNIYNLHVGAGATGAQAAGATGEASWFNNTSEVYAVGGAGGAAPNGGTANGGIGTTTGCIGTTVYAGGDAGNGTTTISGGGGGGAGTLGNGGDASGRIGGTGTANGGGNGANGRNNNEGNGVAGSNYGGGGSGAFVPDVTNHAGGSGAGGLVEIVYSSGVTYCDPSYSPSSASYFIDDFSTTGGTANITNNNTGEETNGYEDYTTLNVDQLLSNSVNFSITGDGTGTYGFAIWVDWNQDGDFADTGEQVFVTSAYATSASGSFTVPAGATVGATRMRVIADYYNSAPSDPCTGDAETCFEDYTFNVTAPAACATPTDQPTALSLTPVGSNQINGSFTAASSSPDAYLVVYSTNSTLSADPVDGTTYTAGDALGGGTVFQVSSATTFSHTCIAPSTTFYYFIFSVNNACSGGPLYLCSSSTPSAAPLTGNATTGAASADETLPYTQNFDTNDGWTYGAGGTWERGNQTNDAFGPPSGHSGNTVAGTNLNANYGTSIDDYLVSPSFDLSGTSGPVVDFWMDMESEANWDGGTVQIQLNGCSWTTIAMTDPGYSGLIPNDSDVDGLQDLEDGWSGTQPAGEWDQVKIDLFALTTPGLDNIQAGDIVKVRFWFGSDGSSVYPGWYVDDYAIYDPAPCTEPTAQATNLVLTPGYTTIDGTFTAASPAADDYLVVISTDPTLAAGDLPVDGTNYSVGAAIGDGTVVMSGPSNSFTATGLTMGTQYYFFIFSYNATACAGRNYLTTSPLTGNALTLDCSSGTIPYIENFDGVTTPNLPTCWIIEDNSAPSVDWVSYSSGSYSSPNDMHISYDGSNPLDDWAFSPGLVLTGGTTYAIEFYYKSGCSSYHENLEVYYGKGQTSGNMSDLLFRDANFANTNYTLVSVNFTPSTNGVYNFGWHAYSNANQCGIYIDDIFIYEPGPPTISALSKNYLYEDKGQQITISGTNLGSPTSVDIGGVAGTVVSANFSEAVVTFPAGNYANSTLTYTTALGSATATVEIRNRNIIPVDASASADADEHQTITSACNGLYAWYGSTAFNAGDLPGAKTIQVMSGTYAEMVVPNTNLNPVAAAGLIITAKEGQQPVVNASGKAYGFDVDLDYTTIKGFKVQNANSDNIRSQGSNCIISYNECLKAGLAGIRAYNNTLIEHNLVHENTSYGIYLESAASATVSQNTTYKNGGAQGAAGYTREVDLTGTTIYDWEYLSTWTQIPSVDDNTYIVDFGGGNNFPFDFAFWGTQYTAASDVLGISSNGILNLDYGSTSYNISYFNYPLSEDHTNNNTLNCFWDDMDDDSHTLDGEIQYTVRGAAPYRRLIVVWYHRTQYWHRDDAGASNTDYVSVEAKIFETTGVIEYHYNDLVYDTDGDIAEDYDWASSATIGIKKNGTTYDEYHYSSEDDPPQVDVNHGLQGGAIRYTPNPTSGTELYIASGSSVTLENNIMQSIDDGGISPFYVIQAPAGVITTFNYNDVYKGTNTNLVRIGGTDYADLTSWGIGGAGNIETDPKFVNAANGDFHIKSSAAGASFHNGEWPPFTAGSGTWTADSDLSPNVDTGDPADDYSLEQPDNGARLNKGCYGNTPQATKTAVLVGIWTGAVDTVWNVPNNWSDAVVPTGSCVTGPGSDATIPDVSATSGNFPYISNAAEVDNLTIDANAYLTILPIGSLTVCGTLTNNNGNPGLVVQSDATGDGSLIHSTVGVPATVYRNLQGTQYHYISSPILDANTTNIGIQGGTSGVQLYDWDATMQWNGMGATPPSSIDYAPWDPSNPVSGLLDEAKGYAYYYAPSVLTYEGNVNVENFTVTMYMNAGGNANDQGWNLLGNPYASALNWDNVTKPAQMETAIYLFDDNDGTGVQANYRYYVPSGGTGGTYGVGTADATKYIPVGQGFFVKTLQNNRNITIDAASREHSNQVYYKEVQPNLLRATIFAENNLSDELVIRFIDEASEYFDAQFDARKLFPSNPEIPQIFSVLDNNIFSAINSMPQLTKSYDINIGINALKADYSIEFNEFTIEDVLVYLEDTYTNKVMLVKENSNYSFSHLGGMDNDRFILHIVKNHAPICYDVIQDQIVFSDTSFSFSIPENSFIDEDFGDNLTYTASYKNDLLPNWLIFNPQKLNFSGINAPVGDYQIKINATDNCGETAEQNFYLYVISGATSMDNQNNNYVVYPNPTTGIFTVSSFNEQIIKIDIIDASGRLINSKSGNGNSLSIDLSNFASGVYTIKIQTENYINTEKIILK